MVTYQLLVRCRPVKVRRSETDVLVIGGLLEGVRQHRTVVIVNLQKHSLNISGIKSLDFTVTRFLMKLFKLSNINLINESRYYFNFLLPSELLMKRKHKFIAKFMVSLLDYFAI